jgi:hypothetical protein
MLSLIDRTNQTPAVGRPALALAAGLGFIMLLSAGPARAAQIRCGLHGGLSIPNIQGGDNEMSSGYKSRLGPYFGVFAEYPLAGPFSIRAEVNYSSQGGKRNGLQPILPDQVSDLPLPSGLTLYADFRNETILDYIEIPVMGELSWGRTTRVFAHGGPYVGFLVRGKTVTRGSSQLYVDTARTLLVFPGTDIAPPPVSFDADTDVKSDIHSLTAGVAGGVEIAVPLGPGDIVADARFSLGLTNIQRDVAANGKNHTGAAVITLGYAIRLGGRP